MGDAHRGLGVTSGEWRVFRQHFAATLDAIGVADPERNKLADLVLALRPDNARYAVFRFGSSAAGLAQ